MAGLAMLVTQQHRFLYWRKGTELLMGPREGERFGDEETREV